MCEWCSVRKRSLSTTIQIPGVRSEIVVIQHMSVPRAVIFDLGGTLLDWPDWNEDVSRRWALSYDYLTAQLPNNHWQSRDAYVQAMLEAEQAHWQRVAAEQWSGPPS